MAWPFFRNVPMTRLRIPAWALVAHNHVGLVPGAGLLRVLPEPDIADIMLAVFHAPVLPGVGGEVPRLGEGGRQIRDAEREFAVLPGAAGGAGVPADPEDLLRPGPVDFFGRCCQAGAVRGDALLDRFCEVLPQVEPVGDLDRVRCAGAGAF